MAYASGNLALMVEGIGGTNPNLWFYSSTDTFATVKAAGYISDAQTEGMKVRDIVIVFDTATPATTVASVLAVASTGATLSTTGVVVAE